MNILKYGMMTQEDFRANWLPEPYVPPISAEDEDGDENLLEPKPKAKAKSKSKSKSTSGNVGGTKRCTKCGEIRSTKEPPNLSLIHIPSPRD